MRKLILVLVITGAFVTTLVLTPQYAAAHHESDFDAVINAFNILIDAVVAGFTNIGALLGGHFNQSCPSGEVLTGIDIGGAAICSETGFHKDPITGDICIGSSPPCP